MSGEVPVLKKGFDTVGSSGTPTITVTSGVRAVTPTSLGVNSTFEVWTPFSNLEQDPPGPDVVRPGVKGEDSTSFCSDRTDRHQFFPRGKLYGGPRVCRGGTVFSRIPRSRSP